MNSIKENKNILIIIAAVLAVTLFGTLYSRSHSEKSIVTQADSDPVSAELEKCLAKVQMKVDNVTLELNDWLANPESQKYDNSTVWKDVARLAAKDREECHAEFGLK